MMSEDEAVMYAPHDGIKIQDDNDSGLSRQSGFVNMSHFRRGSKRISSQEKKEVHKFESHRPPALAIG